MRLAWRLDEDTLEIEVGAGEAAGRARVALEAPETRVSADALMRWAASELEEVDPAGVEAWIAHLRDDICGNPCAVGALEEALRRIVPAKRYLSPGHPPSA